MGYRRKLLGQEHLDADGAAEIPKRDISRITQGVGRVWKKRRAPRETGTEIDEMRPVGAVGAATGAAGRPAPSVVGDLRGVDGMCAQNISKSLAAGVLMPGGVQGVVIAPALHTLKVGVRTSKPTPQVIAHLAQSRLEQTLRLSEIVETTGDAPLMRDI